MIEGDGRLHRHQPNPPARRETPEQRRAEVYWNRVIEAVPLTAVAGGRGQALRPNAAPVSLSNEAKRPVPVAGTAVRSGIAGAGDEPSRVDSRAEPGGIWRALIDREPVAPTQGPVQGRAQRPGAGA